MFAGGIACLLTGISLAITAELGVGSWQVFETGLVEATGLGFGTVVLLEALGALALAWIWLGERPGAGHSAAHSRREQAGVDPSDGDVAARLAAGNADYERRFGRVFLIRAAGRAAPEILDELQRRLHATDADERAETVRQLREIALLRLEGMLS